MKSKKTSSFFLWWIALCALMCILTACVTGPRIVDHSFGFDAISDSPEIEVLNYRYGDSKLPSTHPPEWALQTGHIGQMAGVNGPMRVGDTLYVKWQIRKTGEIFQDTVDLKSRLPWNIKDDRIYFIVRGKQLYVYLITPERRPADMPPNGPHPYDHLKTITIYPDHTQP